MTYPCGHSAEADFELPAECPLCAKYGNMEVPTQEQIQRKLDKAFKVKPIIPDGRILLREELHPEFAAKARGGCYLLTIEGWHPMRLNLAMQNWISRKLGKDEAIRMFTLAAQAAGCPAATGKRVLHLKLEGFRKKPDADAYDKVVLDALKRSGLITDDDEAGLLGRMGFEAVLGKERRTVLLIGDVA